MKRSVMIPIFLTILSVIWALPAAFATPERPFNGHMSGNSVATSQTSNHITATIFLEHLGRSQLDGTTTVTGFSDCNGFIGTEQDTITAPNGDQIFLSGDGVSCPASPTVFQDTVTFRVTGGTGRFADATGSGKIQTTINITSQTTAIFTATISGTATY